MPCKHGMIGGYPATLCVGDDPVEIVAGGRRYLFEWNHYCGPTVLHRRTQDPLDKQPPENSPFWDAATWWHRQGKRVENGVAVWNRECEAEFEKIQIGPRTFLQGKIIRGACCLL